MKTLLEVKRQLVEEFSFDKDEVRETLEHIIEGDDDFEVGTVRFIHTDAIDEVQQKELLNDMYTLGCFNASFVASILGIDIEAIESMQKAEAFEAIGMLLSKHIEEVQGDYSSQDGYGHHFNGYDFNEEEITINGVVAYHAFDNK